MTPENLKKVVISRLNPDNYEKKYYPNGKAFYRLTLTLSAKGWSASIEFEGTTGFKGRAATPEKAIDDALNDCITKGFLVCKPGGGW